MDEILRRAELLGELLRRDERFRELRAAEAAVEADEKAKKLLMDLNEMSVKMAEKERKMEPIEVDEKHALAKGREEVAACEPLKRLSKAQADFAELMNKVNSGIRRKLEGEDAGRGE